jgi:hypothetical protein
MLCVGNKLLNEKSIIYNEKLIIYNIYNTFDYIDIMAASTEPEINNDNNNDIEIKNIDGWNIYCLFPTVL